MAVNGMPLWQAVTIGLSYATIYTSPTTGGQTQISAVEVCNTSTSPEPVQFFIVPSGVTPSSSVQAYAGTISGGETRRLSEIENQWLNPGDSVGVLITPGGVGGVLITYGSGYVVSN